MLLFVYAGKCGYDSFTLPGKYGKGLFITKERFAKIFGRRIVCGEIRPRQKLSPALGTYFIGIMMQNCPCGVLRGRSEYPLGKYRS